MKRFLVIAVCGVAIASCMGCEMIASPFLTLETVTVMLPDPHPAVLLAAAARDASVTAQESRARETSAPAGRPSWTLRWRTGSGRVSEIRGITGNAEIRLERGTWTPILAVPETRAAGIPDGPFPCAGAIYPLHAERGRRGTTIETGWARGLAAVCAETVLSCAEGGYGTGYAVFSRFNWNRFIATASALADPGAIDMPRIAEAILSGSVSVRDIRERSRLEVSISSASLTPADQAIAAGTVLFPVWPGAKAIVWPIEDNWLISVPEGLSRYFCAEGFLVIDAHEGKSPCVFFGAYGLQD